MARTFQYFMYADGLKVTSQEAAFYVLLKPLQGGAIPALFGIPSLTVPGAGLLVLKLIEGMPLFDLDEITPEVAEAALDALAQVCLCILPCSTCLVKGYARLFLHFL